MTPPPGVALGRLAGFALIVVAAVTWGTTGATMKLVARHSPMSPLLVGFFRVAFAAPALVVTARILARPRPRTTPGDRLRLLAGGLAMGAYQACYFWAVAKTSVAVGSLIAICSAPLVITLLAALWLGERIGPVTGAALGVGIVGAALLTAGPHGLGSPPPGFLASVGLALGAGLSYAVYAVAVKDLAGRLPPLAIASGTFTVAAVSLLPALVVERPTGGPVAWAWLAYLGLVPTALAYGLYTVGLRTTPVTVSGILTLVEPLTATTLGVLVFGDRLGTAGALGALLLVTAVAVLAVGAGAAGQTDSTGG